MKRFLSVPPVSATVVMCLIVMMMGLFNNLPSWSNDGHDEDILQSEETPTLTVVPDPDPNTGMVDIKKRKRDTLNQIYYFDTQPLGNRTPVILVPGRAEEFQHDSWWKKLYKMSQKDDSEFNQHYKMYAYIYDSAHELDTQAIDFSREMRAHFSHLPANRKAVLVTYSLGGLIAREAMQEPDVSDRVSTVFGIAVPYHGSPMFDPDWFTRYFRHPHHSPIRTGWDRLIYRGYMFNKTNLTRGLCWDNFDRSMPRFDAEQIEIQGDQVHHTIPPYKEADHIADFKQQLIIYTSYLENGFTETAQPFNPIKLPKYVLETTTAIPKQALGTILPFYGLTVHSVFTYMNYQLANIPTYTPLLPQGKNIHLYRFNDGTLPLSSMLYLPARETPYNDDFSGLIRAADVAGIRVFVNIDHMHIGEYSMIKSKIKAEDILHPEEGKRTPNEWILHDLEQLAAGKRPGSNPTAALKDRAGDGVQ